MANSGDKKVRTYSSQGVDGMERAHQQAGRRFHLRRTGEICQISQFSFPGRRYR
jgi:hypothetical protein